MSDPMTPAPHPKPLPIHACPNPECRKPCYTKLAGNMSTWRVQCEWEATCGYKGPVAKTKAEAIRLHNALCAASGIPTEELEKLAAVWIALAFTEPHGPLDKGRKACADDVAALISRVTEGKKHE